ncbi:LOW QUALITY PROTEIN: beta-1,4-mannosyl-glycoprotein 4-beta-N-acetylglucosaminyltransferase-like [Paramacrobiotus metropolitanus]|uniref:LOW QUALITY PROTEIN: beta-1,4-mannosyl-glycoprotein 4-beta-N-acetylglucosaminyltransferase-like n=1 Tax=Paramacrobiotus metropolitanus TaxID=2943436 RepID=UPI002445EA71|nr:LOW QUALITY PROTEIN: beta-1,4-mannosyl-glycoprotein 4-beta-N-acetylglucosaminyltransferase-like [Paramacrobiotus metropolitanus]
MNITWKCTCYAKVDDGGHIALGSTLVSVFFLICIFVYLLVTTNFIRDVGYITRPLWDRPEEKFTLAPARVVDAIIFSNELDILKVRLRELWDVVDLFVILESNRTFSGNPKPYFFAGNRANRQRFAFAETKLVVGQMTTLTALKPGQNPFDNETEMRRQMNQLSANTAHLRPGDLLLITHVDEIPRKETVAMLRMCNGWPETYHLQMTNYVYSFEFKAETDIWRPKIRRVNDTGQLYFRARSSDQLLMDAGWHCSFCFRNVEDFVFKMQAYSHVDRVTDKQLLIKEEIQIKICAGKDIFDIFLEAFTFRELLWNWQGAHRSYAVADLPRPVIENPVTFKFLLPGGCQRE